MPTQPHHLVINPVFDSSVTSSPEKTEFESAVNTAISYLESKIATPITVSISFGYGEVGGQSIPVASGAESISDQFGYSYAQFYDAIQATDKTSPIQTAAAASLPATDPTGGATIFIAAAEALALGLSIGGLTGGLVGNVGLSVDNYAWSETGSIGASQSDAVSELEHEITEVIGRTDQAGAGNSYTPLDFFRYTAANGLSGDAPGSAAGVRDEPFVTGYSANAFSYFSYDGKHVTLQYDTPAGVAAGDDVADWNQATTGNNSFDGEGSPGAFYPLSTTDLAEMNVLGFEAASPHDNFVNHGASDFLIENTARAVETGELGSGGTTDKLLGDLGSGWTLVGNGDVLGSGDSQVLIESTAGALDAVGFAGGVASYKLLADLPTGWSVKAIGDFLATGGDQILFREASGVMAIGNEVSGKESLTTLGTMASTWSFVGTGDFLGEGHDQFLIKDAAGTVLMADVVAGKTTDTELATLPTGWKLGGVGDFLSDTKSDLLIESAAGVVYAAELGPNEKLVYTTLGTLGAQWSFVGAGDYLGEGHDQFLIESTAGAVLLGDRTNGSVHYTLVGDLGAQWTFHN